MHEETPGCEERLHRVTEELAVLRTLVDHDQYTGLPVRRSLEKRLLSLLEETPKRRFAVGLVRLDRRYTEFRHSSELAHAILFVTGQRLQSLIPGGIYQSLRLDEFIVLLDREHQLDDLPALGERIKAEVGHPHEYPAANTRLGCHIGLSLYPDHGETSAGLLANAEIALSVAEQKAGGAIVYDPAMGERRRRVYRIQRALNESIQEGLDQYHIAFQPIVDRDRSLHGAEALLRWHHPAIGIVSPGEFIPIAEDYGHIEIIGLWVLFHTCGHLNAWRRDGFDIPIVSVNVSGVQLQQPDFVDHILAIIEASGTPPELIRLELTETAIVNEARSAIEKLALLRSRGIQIMIDDFGTGYSSLSYLQELPVDTIKIAREFVDAVDENTRSREIVRTIIAMARSMNMSTLAEGIETDSQYAVLMEEGCDYYQGFFFGRPVHEQEFPNVLSSYKP